MTITSKNRSGSDVESEQHDIAVLHDILFSLRAHNTFLARALPPTVRNEVVVADRFGADESSLEVSVNHARGNRSRIAAVNRPRADFRVTRGEIRLQSKQMISGPNQPIESGR